MAEVIKSDIKFQKSNFPQVKRFPAWEWEPSVLTALQQSRFPMP